MESEKHLARGTPSSVNGIQAVYTRDPAVYTIMHNSLLYILTVYVDDYILVGKQGHLS